MQPNGVSRGCEIPNHASLGEAKET